MSPRSAAGKVLARDRLVERYARPRADVLVFTNGCFDLLHLGHLSTLEGARALGDKLVVGVNSDASVRRLGKGTDRPLVREADRALLVAALESVDAVCLFDEDTPEVLISQLVPDVLVKGADYEEHQMVGRDVVEHSGGRVERIPLRAGYSTSALVERIRGARR